MSSLDHLPDARDGLTAIERAVLSELGPAAEPHRRSQAVITDVVHRWAEHPASELYGALVQMAQPFRTRYPLVDAEGQLGTADHDPPAASPYTKARLSPAGAALIGPDGVPEPDSRSAIVRARLGVARPALTGPFPTLLANGSWEGLASLPPHNVHEVAAAISARIDDPTLDLDGLMQHLPGPDFPTGGVIVDPAEVRAAYDTGRGSIRVRGVAHIETFDRADGRVQAIVVTEVPFLVAKAGPSSVSAAIVRIGGTESPGIFGPIRDESDRRGLRLLIELQPGVDADEALELLYARTDLEITFPVLGVVLVADQPQQCTLLELVDHYIEHQRASRLVSPSNDPTVDIDASIKRDLADLAEGLDHLGVFSSRRLTSIGLPAA